LRPLEIIAACLLSAAALLFLWKGFCRPPARLLLAAAFLALILHGFVEGPHWQMSPAYLAALVLAAALPLRKPLLPRLLSVFALLLIGATILCAHILPMFTLPKPDGPFEVGTSIFNLTDPSRQEPAPASGKREVILQAWYPSGCSGTHSALLRHLLPYRGLAPYRRWKETTPLSSYQRFVWTHSCENGAVATGGPFPVLLFSPAIYGRRTQSTFLMEELASYGYVVFALDHPYSTGPIELADGTVLDTPPSAIEPLGEIGFDRAYQILNRLVNTQTADTLFVLNTLEQWNRAPSHLFCGRLDLDHVGTLGHSLGGSVAAETALVDPRIRAVFDMSGPLLSRARTTGVTTPFFFMTEHVPLLNAAQLARLKLDARVDAEMDVADFKVMTPMLAQHGEYFAELPTGNHAAFTDRPSFSPYVRFGGSDPAETARLDAIIRQYAVAFFQQTLRGQPSPLLQQQPSPYAGVQFYKNRK
jgi:dienelactone hydrolase